MQFLLEKRDFDKSISDKDLPKIQIYFTSEENTYGIITSQWLNGDATSVNIDPNEKLFPIKFL